MPFLAGGHVVLTANAMLLAHVEYCDLIVLLHINDVVGQDRSSELVRFAHTAQGLPRAVTAVALPIAISARRSDESAMAAHSACMAAQIASTLLP